MRGLGVFFDSLLLSDVVLAYSLIVCYCDGIFFRICSSLSTVFLSPESSIIESCPFTVSFVRLISLVLLVHVHCSFDL